MRGPAASRYTGVGTALWFRSRVSVGPKPTASPASSRRTSRTASRMIVTVPRGFPMLRVEMNPGAMVSRTRPGASSSRLCASEASSSGCRTIGLDVAGKRARRRVARAARARATYASRPLDGWSWMPTPSRPAASQRATTSASSGSGRPTGTRRLTRRRVIPG